MWLLPFLGPFLSILLLLMLGLCTFNLLLKFISSRLEQFKKQIRVVLSCNTINQGKRKHSSWICLRDSSTILLSWKQFQKLDLHPFTPSLRKNNKKQYGMKGSGQFPSLPDCSWPSQSNYPTHWTAHVPVILTCLIVGGLIETLSHHAQQTSSASHNGLWSDWPSCTWEQSGPLLNPLSQLTSWKPEVPA